jgi:hypothetical protein
MKVCIVGASGKLVPPGVHRYSAGTAQAVLDFAAPGARLVFSSNLTRRVDFALFMVAALATDELVQEAPAIVGCQTPPARAHAADPGLLAGHRRRPEDVRLQDL